MWRDIVALARSWWQVDRIRTPPRDGALLRLSPPCLVRVRGAVLGFAARRHSRGLARGDTT